MPGAPELAVVVLDVPGGDAEKTVASLTAATTTSGLEAETVVIRQTPGPASTVNTLDVFPLGSCYARNRGATETRAPLLAFVDSAQAVGIEFCRVVVDELGGSAATVFPQDVVVCRREEFEAAGGFDHALGLGTAWPGAHELELADRLGARRSSRALTHPTQARGGGAAEAVAAGRVARRQRNPLLAARAALRGGLAGVLGRAAWAPPDPLPHLPAELRNAVLAPLSAANPAKTHFVYGTEAGVLHLHINPSQRLRRAVEDRELIRARTTAHGIPELRAAVAGRDCLWLLEDRVRGAPPRSENTSVWFPRVAEWAVEMAAPADTTLNDSPHWHVHVDEAQAIAPATLRGALGRAGERAGALPATAMHGDLQRQNVFIEGDQVGAVDWEGAWLHGIPGLDLVFLALFAEGDRPDFALLELLVRGDDVPWGGIRAALARLGVDAANFSTVLLVMLATWALSEDRRRRRLGSLPPAAVFGPLLRELGPRLSNDLA